ncbi:MAG: glutathione S-transferase N-terminal domain-containing protein [Leptothrix sp. (in: b-proteobacteria)]
MTAPSPKQPAQPALPLLYSHRRCPYAMRARMALLQAQRAFRVQEVVLRDKPAALRAISPKATVPVLQLPDGRVLEQSWDIMRWALTADAVDHPAGWWQRAQSADNMALLHGNDGAFKQLLDRYKYADRARPLAPGDPLDRDAVRNEAVTSWLVPLEARLQAEPQLGGATPCATDLALFPFVRQFAAVDAAWFAALALPALQAWLAAWLGSALFSACMARVASGAVVDFPLPPG